MNQTLRLACATASLLLALPACTSDTSGGAVERPAVVVRDSHGDPDGLHRYKQWNEKVGVGAQPEGEVAFANLAAMGYKTVVSVDGAKPEADLAAKYGLRYVHVPIGYDKVGQDAAAHVAKAIETSDGPTYVHCHHGKHRGPAAAASACVALGLMDPAKTEETLKAAGTDPKYAGLYRTTAATKRLSGEELAAVPVNPAYVSPGDLAAAMADLDFRWEYLKASKERAWGLLPDHPDVSPPHEARMAWEGLREMARMKDATSQGGEFMKMLADSEAAVAKLEAALRAGDPAAATASFDAAAKLCGSCHKKFRDN
ncbi:MAG: hypothetical protein HMLKMBBP_00521 [Planctomycetes bacterium]|nr:hypothetical protein [Planctomycetota bacterium]